MHTTRQRQQDAPDVGARPIRRQYNINLTRDILLQAHRKLRDIYVREPYRNHQATFINLANEFEIPRRMLRAFLLPDGTLTQLGTYIETKELLLPEDRKKANLPPVKLKTNLSAMDLEFASRMIGLSNGKLSRNLFCDLFLFDPATIFEIIAPTGSITTWWLQAMEDKRKAGTIPEPSARATTSSQAGATSAANAGAIRTPWPINYASATPEQQLHILATHHNITLSFGYGNDCHTLGTPGAPLVGHVAQIDNHWCIYLASGGEYHFDLKPRTVEHVVNTLKSRVARNTMENLPIYPSPAGGS